MTTIKISDFSNINIKSSIKGTGKLKANPKMDNDLGSIGSGQVGTTSVIGIENLKPRKKIGKSGGKRIKGKSGN